MDGGCLIYFVFSKYQPCKLANLDMYIVNRKGGKGSCKHSHFYRSIGSSFLPITMDYLGPKFPIRLYLDFTPIVPRMYSDCTTICIQAVQVDI